MATKRKSKSLAKRPDRTVAGTQFKTGFETVDMEIIQIPRVKIVQKTSEEFDDGVPFLSLVNSVSKDILKKGTKAGSEITIIPVRFTKSRIYFADMKEGGGLLCRSFDAIKGVGDPGGTCGSCDLKNWDQETDAPPACSVMLNFFSIVRDYQSTLPLVISFGKTSMKAGKQFYNMLLSRHQQGYNPAGYAFKLQSVSEKNDKGVYGVYKVTPDGDSTDDEFNQATEFIRLMDAATVTTHAEAQAAKDDALDDSSV